MRAPKSWKPNMQRCNTNSSVSATSRRAGFHEAIQSEIKFALILINELRASAEARRALSAALHHFSAGAFAELHGDIHFFAAAIERYRHGIARPFPVEEHVHVELPCNFLRVNSNNDVATDVDPAHAGLRYAIAAANSGGGCRPAFCGPLHKQAFFHGKIQRFTKPAVHR